ncbi:MAG TPA: hypothetical protein VFS04_00435 [Alphaproteobacteria bacterium]|nr:hypothetical protein [Alphaproteobacteria bacterium]
MPTRVFRAAILAGAATLALGAALGVATPASAQSAPANGREQAAFDVRFLQTEFMVAALSCGRPDYQQFYNTFVTRFGAPLKRHADVLKAHFTREYGKQGANKLDSFATKLANEASLRSMQQVTFCQDTGLVMERVSGIDVASLDSFSASFARSIETVAATSAKTR